jgi:hypothetical protein
MWNLKKSNVELKPLRKIIKESFSFATKLLEKLFHSDLMNPLLQIARIQKFYTSRGIRRLHLYTLEKRQSRQRKHINQEQPYHIRRTVHP